MQQRQHVKPGIARTLCCTIFSPPPMVGWGKLLDRRRVKRARRRAGSCWASEAEGASSAAARSLRRAHNRRDEGECTRTRLVERRRSRGRWALRARMSATDRTGLQDLQDFCGCLGTTGELGDRQYTAHQISRRRCLRGSVSLVSGRSGSRREAQGCCLLLSRSFLPSGGSVNDPG